MLAFLLAFWGHEVDSFIWEVINPELTRWFTWSAKCIGRQLMHTAITKQLICKQLLSKARTVKDLQWTLLWLCMFMFNFWAFHMWNNFICMSKDTSNASSLVGLHDWTFTMDLFQNSPYTSFVKIFMVVAVVVDDDDDDIAVVATAKIDMLPTLHAGHNND